MVAQALAVPVLLGGALEHDGPVTFGTAVRAKLAEAGASAERWTSWKDSSGWMVKLEFTANGIDHDARWGFDPRRSTLSPQNSDASSSRARDRCPKDSSRGCVPGHPLPKDDTRFDSGAFGPRRLDIEDEPGVEATGPVAAAVQAAAIKRAPDAPVTSSETADLLEALRRRRGQREPLPGAVEAREPEQRAPSAPVALFDALEPEYRAEEPETEPERTPRSPGIHRLGSTDEGSTVDAVVGRDRVRSPHGRELTPVRQAKAPKRRSGTVRSSSVSEPCWPTMRCGRLSLSRSS